jgi:hypothetical protein
MTFEQEQLWRRIASDDAAYDDHIVTDADKDSYRAWVKEVLHNGIALVEFVKADGTERVMKCTLSDLHGAKYTSTPIVETAAAVDAKPKKVNTDTCPVWDIDAGAWRSFRWDRLKRIDFEIG